MQTNKYSALNDYNGSQLHTSKELHTFPFDVDLQPLSEFLSELDKKAQNHPNPMLQSLGHAGFFMSIKFKFELHQETGKHITIISTKAKHDTLQSRFDVWTAQLEQYVKMTTEVSHAPNL
jgi:hypothetical protein